MVSGNFELWPKRLHVNPNGMSVVTTMMFVVGEMAGAGILAMPGAMRNSTWYGIILLTYGAIASGYTGCQLSWCWTTLQELWPKYTTQTRKPYSSIAERAMGKVFKYLVSGCMTVGLWAAATVYVILAADQIRTVLQEYAPDAPLTYCYLVLIVAGCLWPITMLGTPTDFWLISFLATISSTVAVVLIVVGSLLDRASPPFYLLNESGGLLINSTTSTVSTPTHVQYPTPTFLQFVLAYSAITFAYGGHSAFPTMQHDMKHPKNFWKSVVFGYIVIAMLYYPAAIVAYVCYGDLLSGDYAGNVTGLITTGWIRVAISILTGGHVCFAFFITINPVNQEIEQIIKIPHEFTWKRFATRTITLLLSVFVAESLPQFGNLLDLIGATTITSLTYIFPPLFYLALKKKRHNHYKKLKMENDKTVRTISGMQQQEIWVPDDAAWHEYGISSIILFLGLLAGIGGTYSSIKELALNVQFKPPCYLQ